MFRFLALTALVSLAITQNLTADEPLALNEATWDLWGSVEPLPDEGIINGYRLSGGSWMLHKKPFPGYAEVGWFPQIHTPDLLSVLLVTGGENSVGIGIHIGNGMVQKTVQYPGKEAETTTEKNDAWNIRPEKLEWYKLRIFQEKVGEKGKVKVYLTPPNGAEKLAAEVEYDPSQYKEPLRLGFRNLPRWKKENGDIVVPASYLKDLKITQVD